MPDNEPKKSFADKNNTDEKSPENQGARISLPPVKPKRRNHGCLITFIAFAIIWLTGVWILWKASLSVPEPDQEERRDPFHFILPSDESSSVEMEDEKDKHD